MLSLRKKKHSVLVFLMLFIFCFHSHLTSSSPSAAIPLPHQCHALLQFKSNFVINASASDSCYSYESSYPKTESWKENTDCCSSWDGVTCDGESGHVIGLDLSCSQLQGTIHSNSTLFSSYLAPYLRLLDLSCSDLSTSIGFLDIVGNHLKYLRQLNLADCNISGSVPPSFGNLIELTHLHLENNHLIGPVPPSLGNLTNFVSLYLRGNHLNGPIPTSFSNLTHLTYFDMSSNELDGPLPSYLFAFRSLKSVDLSCNMLHGQIPTSPVESMNLTRLNLSNNNLSGSLDFDVFLTFKNLQELYLSNNNISSSTSIYTNLSYSLPSFELLDLSGCKLNQFPTFMKALTNLRYLYFYNNQIQGSLPEWIYDVGKDTLSVIDLSENRLTSVGHQLYWNNIEIIYFHSNLLRGPLPIPPTTTTIFSVSNNSLSGEINSLVCNLSHLHSFDLSHNKFVGLIPECLGSLSNLSSLNLGVNNLHGLIPNTFAKHNSLNSLVLKGNQLTGTIPRTLSYCHNLQILDMGNNMIEDTVPRWLETLSSLEVLVLRSNKFYGSLNGFKDRLLFPALRILDLSNNNFVGRFPFNLIKNLNAMTKVDESLEDGRKYMMDPIQGWYYSMTTIVKGYEMEYIRILTALVTIDLSRNKFEGHIPEVIGKLISLKGLNLSHNLLTGHIPSSMGGLRNLEWLDLSHNKLSGQIPREMSDLNSLGTLNLSSNQFHGAIPPGRHFDTFANDSYKDNLALCGFPLTKTCGPDHEPPSDAFDNKSSLGSEGRFSWEGAFAGYGCGIVLGLSMGYHVFKTRSPKWFVKMLARAKN